MMFPVSLIAFEKMMKKVMFWNAYTRVATVEELAFK